MLQPKKVKHRKQFKGRVSSRPTENGSYLAYGDYGLKILEPCRIMNNQIEAMRRAMSRELKKKGKLIIRIFPDVPLTAKPAETRMGGGKGSVDKWCALVQPGRILFEVVGANYEVCKHAFALASAKLGVKTRLTSREGRGEL